MAGLALMTAAYAVSANRLQSPVAHTKSVGTFRAVIDTIDYLDTSQAYTAQSLWALWTVYETLVTYRHVAGAAGYQVVPGLASLPKISRGGKVLFSCAMVVMLNRPLSPMRVIAKTATTAVNFK